VRRIDTIAAICAVVSSMITYYESEDFYAERYDDNGNLTKARNESSGLGNALRGVNMAFTLAICILVYLHYKYKLKILKLRKLKL